MRQTNDIFRPHLFSILIANYNNGRYLQEAIDSVLAQTYTNWEIVLVDDKSTDNSFDVYEKYRDNSRFHIYYNEENKGCGYTKRRCVELAKGGLCGFLDPDDRLSPEALKVMEKVHEQHPKCSLAYSTLYMWDDASDSTKVLVDVGAMENGEDFLISSTKIISHFAVFKKSFYEKTIGIDKTLSSAVDFDLYIKLEEVGDLCFINQPLYYYRQNNPQSISIGSNKASEKAFHNRMTASLNAFVRRIKRRLPSYVRNREQYLSRMRWQLGTYKRRVGKMDLALVHYCWWYIWANKFSARSFNHIRKILL